MHRTQVMLEEWQYQSLKAGAEQRGLSMSELLREILAEYFGRPRGGLGAIEGLGEDAGSVARDHDAYLYGKKKR